MLPYQAHISPDTTYTETDSSSVGQGVHGEEFVYLCLFLNKQINKQFITGLETKSSSVGQGVDGAEFHFMDSWNFRFEISKHNAVMLSQI